MASKLHAISSLLAIFIAAVTVHGADPARDGDERGPTLKTDAGELAIFPADNPWNRPIDKLPVHPRSAAFIESIGRDKPLHPDFGMVYNGAPSGIPYCIAKIDQDRVPIKFEYGDESDPGPYPIPDDAPLEGGPKSDGDRHVLVLDPRGKKLYELFRAFKTADGWRASSGAVFDLTSNKLRPAGWTSADAAGLPILPGLVRYDEAVEKHEIRHALRVTVEKTQRGYIAPATHWASTSSDPNRPPMGLRVRLKASFDTSRFPLEVQAILKALKTYGLIVADNGGNWFITGAPDPRWNDDNLHALRKVLGRDMEAVDTGPIVTK